MFRTQVIEEIEKREKASAIRLLDALVLHACEESASDIHIDPIETFIRVRFRIDGLLQDTFVISHDMHENIIGRIKVICGLRTDEHGAPQDGRFKAKDPEGLDIDIRVSILATYYGENAVMRLLRNATQRASIASLYLPEAGKAKLLDRLKASSGMILVTGPTGSGKTTTLYAFLETLTSINKLIVTIEDPVEYALPGIRQIQTNQVRGLTFAAGLRSILRQDPDIIMVGEIRDAETARIAINAALTGHLILSTLHTRDAASALPRLIDMGIDPYLIASTVEIVIAQRLVRKRCLACNGAGCDNCNASGYKSRLGIFEILFVSEEIRAAILNRRGSACIRDIAVREGMALMTDDGMAKAAQGLTSREEVIAHIQE